MPKMTDRPCHPDPEQSRRGRTCFLLIVALLFALPAHAHIGSPDTFVQATAGPYKFLVTAHPPSVYPGALELDLRLNPDDHITTATVSLDNSTPTPIQIFDAGTATASIWLPDTSTHTLHILLQGSAYDLALPASSSAPHPPNKSYSIALIILALAFLGFGGWKVFNGKRHLGFALFAISVIAFGLAASAFIIETINNFYFGQRTTIIPTLTSDGHLNINLSSHNESFADIVPDHGKLLHLFLVRQPQQDVFLHLHPHQLSPGHFSVPLPAMPPGTYRLFADYYLAPAGNLKEVHGETPTIALDLPAQFRPSAAPDPDDSIAVLPPNAWVARSSAASSPMGGIATSDGVQQTFTLRDGYTLQLVAPANIQPLRANLFQVTLLDPSGHPPADMALYLGMSAHAVVLRDDNSVFAHIHPGGTLPMLTSASSETMPMDMSMPMDMLMSAASNTATIPYGFPTAGHYRLFVQMKHGPIIETAAFDLAVE